MLGHHLKKKLLMARVKRNQMVFQHAKQHEEELEKAREAAKAKKSKEKEESTDGGEEVWSAKTQEIRNKLTGKKRASRDRWNRFAGTGGEGGRGR